MYTMSIGKHTFVMPFHWTAISFDLTIGPTIFQMLEQLAFQPFTNQWNESIVNYPIFNGRTTDPRFFDKWFTELLAHTLAGLCGSVQEGAYGMEII